MEGTMKKALLFIIALFLVCITPFLVLAGNFDGSGPLLCAVIETFDCVENDACTQGKAYNIGIPQFLNIDFKTMTMRGVTMHGKERTAKIKNIERVNGKLILQGIQNDRGWSMVIAEADGMMTITASDDQIAFVVFGACTSQ
jgi:hypothetical protein